MLKRLGLVIHWAGYFGATWITAAVGYQLINIGIEHADLDDCCDSPDLLEYSLLGQLHVDG